MNNLVLSNGDCLAKISGFRVEHGITTNKFGDCGFSKPDHNTFERQQNLRLLKLAEASSFFKIVPEHNDRIKKVKPTNKVCNYLKCDALVSDQRKTALISNTADCPIIFLTDNKNFIAIIHSGWRGTNRNIAGKTIEKVKIYFKVEAKNIQAGVWGGICPDCYEVGNDLKKYFPGKIKNGHLNLRRIITGQLLNSGVRLKNIFLADNYCSAHSLNTDNFLFASFRRDRNKKRNATFITF